MPTISKCKCGRVIASPLDQYGTFDAPVCWECWSNADTPGLPPVSSTEQSILAKRCGELSAILESARTDVSTAEDAEEEANNNFVDALDVYVKATGKEFKQDLIPFREVPDAE